MLKCKQAVEKADALIDGTPISRRERLALRVHLLMCHHCRRYLDQLRALLGSLPQQHCPADDHKVEEILRRLDKPEP